MTLNRPMFPPHLTLATVKGQPATQAERDAMSFEPIPIKFNWTNENWALAHLPKVRLASVLLAETPEGLQEKFEHITKANMAPELLEGLCEAKQQFTDMAKLLDVAISRSFLVLERLGYGPDNPPPDGEDEAGPDESA